MDALSLSKCYNASTVKLQYPTPQWRQSCLKSGGSWIRAKKLMFTGKNFDFFQAISQKFLIFEANFEKFRFVFRQFKENSIFQAKIGHLGLQLPVGKLFYFSAKVTTFEHTSCT